MEVMAAAFNGTMTKYAEPEWLNSGDNAWQMVAATLVSMMSIPGLAAIYAGIVRVKWAPNAALMAFYAFAITLLCWVLFAYKMAFGERMTFFWGKPGVALGHHYLLQQAALPASEVHNSDGTLKAAMEMPKVPMATMVYFQFAFAAVTVVLVAGSLLSRMKFRAWLLFVPLWITLSYTVSAFSIWGGGFLYRWGVIDFAGGFVVHLSAGTAGYTAAYWVKRRPKNEDNMKEAHSWPLVTLGAGLLWLGWTGFNGGAPFMSGLDASMAILNTYISAATSVVVWTSLDVICDGDSSLIHAVQGMIVGLVCITPAAGVVEGWAAIVFGFVGGLITWYITTKRCQGVCGKLENKGICQGGCLGGVCGKLRNVDDALRVVETHAIPGVIGGLLVGLLAEPDLCDLYLPIKGTKGAFYGDPLQLAKQLIAALFVFALNVVMTCIICFVIFIFIPSLRHERIDSNNQRRVASLPSTEIDQQHKDAKKERRVWLIAQIIKKWRRIIGEDHAEEANPKSPQPHLVEQIDLPELEPLDDRHLKAMFYA